MNQGACDIPASLALPDALDPVAAAFVRGWAAGDAMRERSVLLVVFSRYSLRSVSMVLGTPKSTIHGWIEDFRRAVEAQGVRRE